MIDLKQLKALIKLMVVNDLTEIDLQDPEGERVKVKRGAGEPTVQVMPQTAAAPAPAAAAQPATPAPAEPAAPEPSDTAGLVEIPSPMVGTFYASSSPDADPFVSVGDSVGPDTVVCLVEAMKVFNEIKAETSGKIEKVLVESGQAIEFGQALFLVKPA